MTSAAYDGFNLSGTSGLGGRFVTQSGDGWLSKTLRRDRQDKAQQDGVWGSWGFTAATTITVAGHAVYPDAASAATERRSLMALGGRGSAPLTVLDAVGEFTRMVELDQAIISPVRASMFTWSFTVTASDPLLYGPEVFDSTTLAPMTGGAGLVYPLAYPLDYGLAPGVTPGAITIQNAGTASYFPRMRIDGGDLGVTNPVVTLVETGDFVRFNGTVGPGQRLDINWGVPRRVTIGDNPVSMRHKVTYSGNWLAVPVGGGSIAYSADDADPTALLSVWSYEGAWE